jgi:hypothetical protein
MPTQLTLQTDMSSFTLSAADATGNTFDNSTGDVYMHAVNGDSSSTVVTVAEQRTCNFGHATTNDTYTIGAGATRILGPFDLLRFNNSSRLVSVTYSSVTSLTVAAVRG